VEEVLGLGGRGALLGTALLVLPLLVCIPIEDVLGVVVVVSLLVLGEIVAIIGE